MTRASLNNSNLLRTCKRWMLLHETYRCAPIDLVRPPWTLGEPDRHCRPPRTTQCFFSAPYKRLYGSEVLVQYIHCHLNISLNPLETVGQVGNYGMQEPEE